MNKLRRFIIGTLFIAFVTLLSVSLPGAAMAAAPSAPNIYPNGSTIANMAVISADPAAFVTGYTVDGTEPTITCVSLVCTPSGTTQASTVPSTFVPVAGPDGSNITVKATSYDSDGLPGPTAVKSYIFDNSAPVITGVSEGVIYNHPVVLSVSDASSFEVFVNHDATSDYYTTSPIPIIADGSYTVYAQDTFMHMTSMIHFVIDQTAPTISLNGGSVITVEARSPYNELGVTTYDVNGQVTTWQEGNLNTGVVGTYYVTYYAQDVVGNTSSVTRTIHVVDTTAPNLVLNGSNNVTLEVHSSYTELGATAWDNYDGNLTPNIVITGSVDIHHVGVYTPTYTVTDTNGNVSTVTRTVHVVDTTAPVLTLFGNTVVTLEVHSAYVEAGYSAVDNYDGDITANVVVTGSVNVAVVGVYTLTYTITDANGNTSVLTRTVNIVDTTKPVITLNGLSDLTLEVHSPYVELGATTLDNYDGDITSKIVVTGSVDVHHVGVYTLTYTITDANGNTSQVTRTVRIVDTTKPVITLIGNTDVTLEVFSSYLELGATAVDNYDGIVFVQILGSVNTSVLGNYVITYVSTDANGNTAFITRLVHVVDTTPPVISLLGLADVTIEVHSIYVEPGYIAIDNYDGNITALVLVNNPVNVDVVGTYYVTYNVVDSSGNVAGQVTRTVHVVDTTAPMITIIGQNPAVIEAGTAYVDLGATAWDNYDGNLTAIIIVVSDVNTNLVGVYHVTYTVTDTHNNTTVAIRTVVVVDTAKPIITLVGGATITLEVHNAYTELGATAWDSYDGVLIVSITGSVNVDVVGTYVITYTATDSHGNVTSVTRTIHVVDTTAPNLVLNGSNNVTLEVHSSYTELGATAWDNYDGNLTPNIVVSGSVDIHHVGVYTLTYTVTDTNGNVSTVTRTVHVVDTTAPVLTLFGNTVVTLEVHSAYVEAGYSAVDNYDGDITVNVVVTGSVNVHVVGVYTLTYTITDANGNTSVLTRTVNIVDTTKPVITLNGNADVTLYVGDVYNELGAIASDNYDGVISTKIVISGVVNTSQAGTYTIVYTVTDANGNTSSVVRIVHVLVRPSQTVAGGPTAVSSELGSDAISADQTANPSVKGDKDDEEGRSSKESHSILAKIGDYLRSHKSQNAWASWLLLLILLGAGTYYYLRAKTKK